MYMMNVRGCPGYFRMASLFFGIFFATMVVSAVVAGDRGVVFIYVASETAPNEAESENYRALIELLRRQGHEKLDQIAESLVRDLERFPAAVDEEIDVLGRRLPGLTGVAPAAVVFTNRLLRRGRYLEYRPGWPGLQKVPLSFPIPRLENPIAASNPVCNPEVFSLLLTETARRFDPSYYEFVLMTKSHGNPEMAMTPRVSRLASDIKPEDLAALAGIGDRSASDHAAVPRLGISRRQYFDLLNEQGRTEGMEFALVYIEACQGHFAEALKERLPANVRRAYVTAGGAQYRNVDFERLFDRMAEGVPLADALEQQLADRQPGVMHTPPWRRWLWLGFWLPLVAWLVWLVFQRRCRPSPPLSPRG